MAKSKKSTKTAKPKKSETKVRKVQQTQSSNSFWRTALVVAGLILGLLLLYSAFTNNQTDENSEADDSLIEDAEQSQDAETSSEPAENQSAPSGLAEGTTVTETDEAYEYVAGAGESLTVIARQAVAQLDGSLSSAQRVAAETRLAQQAGGQLLDISQNVAISKESVSQAVEWAKSLTEEQQLAWQPYADLVAW